MLVHNIKTVTTLDNQLLCLYSTYCMQYDILSFHFPVVFKAHFVANYKISFYNYSIIIVL